MADCKHEHQMVAVSAPYEVYCEDCGVKLTPEVSSENSNRIRTIFTIMESYPDP